jgi:hypothetical protein
MSQIYAPAGWAARGTTLNNNSTDLNWHLHQALMQGANATKGAATGTTSPKTGPAEAPATTPQDSGPSPTTPNPGDSNLGQNGVPAGGWGPTNQWQNGQVVSAPAKPNGIPATGWSEVVPVLRNGQIVADHPHAPAPLGPAMATPQTPFYDPTYGNNPAAWPTSPDRSDGSLPATVGSADPVINGVQQLIHSLTPNQYTYPGHGQPPQVIPSAPISQPSTINGFIDPNSAAGQSIITAQNAPPPKQGPKTRGMTYSQPLAQTVQTATTQLQPQNPNLFSVVPPSQ